MKISGSLLSMRNDLENYINKVNECSLVDYIHLDIMDTDFVSNYSYSYEEIKTIVEKSKKPIDVHLMVKDISKYDYLLNVSNIEYITVHFEALEDFNIINKIREYKKVGISIKPNTDIEKIYNLLEKIDLVLVMSVEPGKGGQQFIENTYERTNKLKKEIKKRKLNTVISVDGGINESNIKLLDEKNVDIAVIGTYLKKVLSN